MLEHNPPKLKELLHDARDLYQTDHVHFVLVAPTGFTTNLLGSIGALQSIFPSVPITLRPLSHSEFERVLELRYAATRRDKVYTPPVSLDVARQLYTLTGNSLRATFQIIDTWVTQVDALQARTAKSIGEIVRVLQPFYQAEIAKLPRSEQAFLDAARRLGDPFRQKGVARVLQKRQPNLSPVMESLEGKKFILLDHPDAPSYWYRLDERALIAFWGRPRGPGGDGGENAPTKA